MKTTTKAAILMAIAGITCTAESQACTGITLKSQDGATVVARTIEWGGSDLNSQYVIVPRGYEAQSLTPEGNNGMKFTARWGYAGLAVEQKEFIAEGINEAGLSAGLFYFPNYGEYVPYDPAQKEKSINDLQLASWILGECATVDEVKKAVEKLRHRRNTLPVRRTTCSSSPPCRGSPPRGPSDHPQDGCIPGDPPPGSKSHPPP